MSLYDNLWLSWHAALGAFVRQLILYFGLAGLAWLIFYVLFRRLLQNRKIAPSWPTRAQIRWESIYSLRTTVIFALVAGVMYFMVKSGWTQVYLRIEDYGWGWFAASVVIAIFIHDAYFYWTHRLMHDRRLFHVVHQVHHLSMSPTPWATYSFSVVEAFVQAGIGPLLFLVMPIHPAALITFMVWQVFFNVMGHCGYEILPSWFMRSGLGKFFNSTTHHALHHERFRANYSLYFNIWDRLMGTNHRDYEKRFEQVTTQKAA